MSQKLSKKIIFTPQIGLTLIELMISVVIAGILISGITKFLKDSQKSYNLQEQISDRDQNVHYVVKRLQERLMEAGVNLPDSNWDVVSLDPLGGLKIGVNPRGGIILIGQITGSINNLGIGDMRGFKECESILILAASGTQNCTKINIDKSYNSNGFVNGFKDLPGTNDSIHLVSNYSFLNGDAVYAFSEEEYRLSNGNLMMQGVVLAENIDSLTITFSNRFGSAVTNWNLMRGAKLSVWARTAKPDHGLAGIASLRRTEVTTEIRFRNRI